MKQLFWRSIACVTLLLAACGGDSNDPPGVTDYSGTWDLRYNLLQDDCRLVSTGIIGLVDQQVITQTGSTLSITGLGGLLNTDNGEVREDNTLVATREFTGDVFSNGDTCDFSASTTYSNFANEEADSLLSLFITCLSGFACETQAVGSAVRQPS